MTNLEEILFRFGVSHDQVDRGLKLMEDRVKEFSHRIADGFKDTFKAIFAPIAGAFAGEKLIESIHSVVEWGKQLKVTAQEAGTSVEFIQGFQEFAERLGISAEGAANALTILARKMGEARAGSDEAQAAFAKWGININGKSTEEVFYQIADAMHKTADPAMRNALAFDLMGKGAKEIASALPIGAEAMKKIVEEADKLTEGQVEKLREIDQKLVELGSKWKVFWGSIVTGGMDTPHRGITEQAISAKMKELAGGQPVYREMGSWSPNRSGIEERALREQAISQLLRERDEESRKSAATADAQQAKKLREKEIADNQRKAFETEYENERKLLKPEEQLAQLQRDRFYVLQRITDSKTDELDRSKLLVEFAKIDVDIRQKQEEIERNKTKEAKEQERVKKEQARLDREISEEQRIIQFETAKEGRHDLEKYMPSLDQLASSRQWVRTSLNRGHWAPGPFAGIAREIQLREIGTTEDLMRGRPDWAQNNIKRINQLKDILRSADVMPQDEAVQEMKEHMRRMQEHIAELVQQKAAIKVIPDDSAQ